MITPVATGELYSRARLVLLELGYTIVQASPDSLFLRAEKTPSTLLLLLANEPLRMQVVINFVPVDGQTRIVLQPRFFSGTDDTAVPREQERDVDRIVAALRGDSTPPRP